MQICFWIPFLALLFVSEGIAIKGGTFQKTVPQLSNNDLESEETLNLTQLVHDGLLDALDGLRSHLQAGASHAPDTADDAIRRLLPPYRAISGRIAFLAHHIAVLEGAIDELDRQETQQHVLFLAQDRATMQALDELSELRKRSTQQLYDSKQEQEEENQAKELLTDPEATSGTTAPANIPDHATAGVLIGLLEFQLHERRATQTDSYHHASKLYSDAIAVLKSHQHLAQQELKMIETVRHDMQSLLHLLAEGAHIPHQDDKAKQAQAQEESFQKVRGKLLPLLDKILSLFGHFEAEESSRGVECTTCGTPTGCEEGCQSCHTLQQSCHFCSESVCTASGTFIPEDVEDNHTDKDCVLCASVVPECDQSCQNCVVTQQTCEECAKAQCKDPANQGDQTNNHNNNNTTLGPNCVKCSSKLPECPSNCQDCEVTQRSCDECPTAICHHACVICSDANITCGDDCFNCHISPATCQTCPTATCLQLKEYVEASSECLVSTSPGAFAKVANAGGWCGATRSFPEKKTGVRFRWRPGCTLPSRHYRRNDTLVSTGTCAVSITFQPAYEAALLEAHSTVRHHLSHKKIAHHQQKSIAPVILLKEQEHVEEMQNLYQSEENFAQDPEFFTDKSGVVLVGSTIALYASGQLTELHHKKYNPVPGIDWQSWPEWELTVSEGVLRCRMKQADQTSFTLLHEAAIKEFAGPILLSIATAGTGNGIRIRDLYWLPNASL